MNLQSFENLFADQLQDLYSAETQLVKALPKMAKAATAPELQQAINDHLEETRRQVDRLKEIMGAQGISTRGAKCEAMTGLIDEAEQLMRDAAKAPEVLDAGLIAAAQRVEHYEISAYGTVRTYAQMLGFEDAVRLLQQSLDEEHHADDALNQLALDGINERALQHA